MTVQIDENEPYESLINKKHKISLHEMTGEEIEIKYTRPRTTRLIPVFDKLVELYEMDDLVDTSIIDVIV